MMFRRYGIIGLLAVCVALGGFFVYRHWRLWRQGAKERTETGLYRLAPKADKAKVHLYFSDVDQRFLRAEDRVLAQPDSVVERARHLVNALIEGSKGTLVRTIPAETKLLAIYVTQDGIAHADFNRAIREKHPGGSFSELLTIYSIVNTLTLNIAEIQAVKILIEGREAKTLAGHMDIGSPLRPNMLMIK